jgi:hypothetical protein
VNARLLQVARRIRDGSDELARVLDRAQEGWRRMQRSSDDHYLDGVALNLHGFYGGLERLFELIAASVDGAVPRGANWHQLLLEQMTNEIPGTRPAVISDETREALDEYRGFRHIVRNVYTFKFDPVKVRRLVENAPHIFSQAHAELLAFASFLEQLARTFETDENEGATQP